MRNFRDLAFLRTKTSRPLWEMLKPTSGRVMATRVNSSRMCLNSTLSLFRNLRRAGVLKKRLRTAKFEPAGAATEAVRTSPSGPVRTSVAVSSEARRVRSVTSATAAMLARASPRKP